jgi:hypothetical protein
MKQADWQVYHAAYDAAQPDFDYEASDDEAVRRAFPELMAAPNTRKRKRKPSLVSVAKQVAKAGIEVARYEVDPDTGKISVVIGKADDAPTIDITKTNASEWN